MKIRVLHFLESLERAGTSLQLSRYLRSSDPARVEHHVLTVMGGRMQAEFVGQGISISTLGIHSKFHPEIPLGLRKCISQFKPHVLHSYLAQPNLMAAAVGHLFGSPLVFLEERGIELWKRPFWLLIERWLYPRADGILANAQAVAKVVAGRLRIPSDQIQVLPTGVETGRIREGAAQRDTVRANLGLKTEDLCIGTVTRLARLKGNHFLLEAVAPILREDPRIHCVIAGSGPEDATLRHQAEHLGITKQLQFLGLHSNIPALLTAIDIFVHSSTEEGLPAAVLEAMAAGRAIVATDAGGTGELVRDGATGILVPVQDVGALRSALRRLIGSPDLRAEFAHAARNLADQYDWGRVARQRDDFYVSLWPRLRS